LVLITDMVYLLKDEKIDRQEFNLISC